MAKIKHLCFDTLDRIISSKSMQATSTHQPCFCLNHKVYQPFKQIHPSNYNSSAMLLVKHISTFLVYFQQTNTDNNLLWACTWDPTNEDELIVKLIQLRWLCNSEWQVPDSLEAVPFPYLHRWWHAAMTLHLGKELMWRNPPPPICTSHSLVCGQIYKNTYW